MSLAQKLKSSILEGDPHGSAFWDRLFSDPIEAPLGEFAGARILARLRRNMFLLWIALASCLCMVAYSGLIYRSAADQGWINSNVMFIAALLLFALLGSAKFIGHAFRDVLLVRWMGIIYCPACASGVQVVDHWKCVGRCDSSARRHVLSPCQTCGFKTEAMTCTNQKCNVQIVFTDLYNEFEVRNRKHEFVTVANPLFRTALMILPIALTLAYVAYVTGFALENGVFIALAVLAIGTLIFLRPRKLVKNPYFEEEG